MQLKPIAAIIVLLLLVASLSVAGCASSSTTGTTDYSSYYNKMYMMSVFVTPFSKKTNERGNDVYIGVTRQQQWETTIVIEHVGSQAEAAKLYNDSVATAADGGYAYMAFNKAAIPSNTVERWQGEKRFTYTYLGYIYLGYYNSTYVNSWVFEKHQLA